jgi:hypothetical protein
MVPRKGGAVFILRCCLVSLVAPKFVEYTVLSTLHLLVGQGQAGGLQECKISNSKVLLLLGMSNDKAVLFQSLPSFLRLQLNVMAYDHHLSNAAER